MHRVHRARRRYQCGWACGEPIEAGSLYVYSALPPNTEPLNVDVWSVLRLHGHEFMDCPARGGAGVEQPD